MTADEYLDEALRRIATGWRVTYRNFSGKRWFVAKPEPGQTVDADWKTRQSFGSMEEAKDAYIRLTVDPNEP